MTKNTDLESLCKEARAKGLNINEIEQLKRVYYNTIVEYSQKRPQTEQGVRAAIAHIEMQEWVGYAAGASYIRRTIDAIQKGEKK
jgi:hypothetical protein